MVETLESTDAGLEHGTQALEGVPATLRIGYLLSRYPAISHTFLLHEVLGLRQRGLPIETASINPPDRTPAELPRREAEEARTTYYIQGAPGMSAGWTLLWILLSQPAAVLRGIVAVLRTRNLTLGRRIYWFFYLAEALLVGWWMRRQNLKHLHVHFGGAVATVGMLAAAAWRVPFSLTIHGPEELLDVSSYHLREKLEQAAFVICISDFCRSQLCHLVAQKHWRKFHVVRLGVDPAILKPDLSRTGDGTGALQLVCIGRLVPAKGHRTLLEALLLLRDQAVPLRLVLIGDGTEMQALQDFVLEHRLSEYVTFTRSLSHEAALRHLRRADLFVLASFAEGIPVALMEAMAQGVPCVSTFVAGIPELIQDGVEGLLVPPGNAPALAEALLELARDAPRRRTMGVAARRRILRQYNLPCNQELLASTFERLVGDGVRSAPAGSDL